MTPKLSDDQRQALDAEGGAPVFVFDDQRHMTYVLLPAQDFQRIRSLLQGEDFPVRESYPLQDAVAAAEGWADPAMDAYDGHAKDSSPA